MPSKNASNGSSSLSDRDHEAIVAAFKHNKTAFEIDFEAYAATLNLANAASGRTSWSNLKKKLKVSGDTVAAKGADSSTKKRKTAEVEKDSAEGEGDEDEDEDEEVVKFPKKKKKTTSKVAKKGKKAAAATTCSRIEQPMILLSSSITYHARWLTVPISVRNGRR